MGFYSTLSKEKNIFRSNSYCFTKILHVISMLHTLKITLSLESLSSREGVAYIIHWIAVLALIPFFYN